MTEDEPRTATPRRRVGTAAPRPVRRGRRLAHWLLFFIGFAVVVDALVGEKGLMATMRARREYSQLAGDIARARFENARLREQARRLREDPTVIEGVARKELGLMKPGEKLFIIKDIPPPSSSGAGKP